MVHEGEILKNYAKVQKGGITALEKALDLTRSGLRYYLDRTELDLKFKEKIANLYGTSVEDIWKEAEKEEKKPPKVFTSTTTSQKPDIHLKKNPTAKDIEDYVQALMALREKQMEDRILNNIVTKLKG